MPTMADFGIGVASSVLLEIVMAMKEFVEEVKINKKEARILADRAELVADSVTEIVRQHEEALSAQPKTYSTLVKQVDAFKTILDSIKTEMQKWANSSFWTRAFDKSKMASAIQEKDRNLMDQWALFKDFLLIHLIAISAAVSSQLQILFDKYAAARQEDTQAYCALMEAAKRSYELVEKNPVQLTEQGRTFMKILARAEKMQEPQSTSEDPETAAERERLKEAIRSYEGDTPALGIDSSELTIPFADVFYHGHNAYIYKGIRSGKIVAIKRLNTNAEDIDIVYRRIRDESRIWSQLEDQHIVKFLGCCKPKDDMVYMIAEWAENGDARKHISRTPDADRLKMLIEALQGLIYLHSFVPRGKTEPTPIVHAGVKGKHVLIGGDRVARLSDFGIAFIATEMYTGSRPPDDKWSAPEVLFGEKPTIESDTYSFGMVILELITNIDPFGAPPTHQFHRSINRLRIEITKGERPKFPSGDFKEFGLPDEQSALWKVVQQCWKQDPKSRPTTTELLAVLQAEHAKVLHGP